MDLQGIDRGIVQCSAIEFYRKTLEGNGGMGDCSQAIPDAIFFFACVFVCVCAEEFVANPGCDDC